MSVEELARRLRSGKAPGRRGSPQYAVEAERPRGDHDLNPDLYEAGLRLIPAAVLVPIVDRSREPTVLLTRRTEHLNDHAGQISFPGGRVDPGDADAEAAALREAFEEVGLDASVVRLAGRLDTYVTRTGFEVTPVVGLVSPPFALRLDDFEVAEVFEVPLAFILDHSSRRTHSRVYEGRQRFFYAYPYGDHFIWGATAGMLSNLAEVLNGAQ